MSFFVSVPFSWIHTVRDTMMINNAVTNKKVNQKSLKLRLVGVMVSMHTICCIIINIITRCQEVNPQIYNNRHFGLKQKKQQCFLRT